jgi:FkbM family methyltransferase
MTKDTYFVKLNDGTKISVPSDLKRITPFVLEEQGDWFEPEIDFVRRFVTPDMNILDIGANYGLYTNAMAQTMRSNKQHVLGSIWCFEPTPDTARALTETVVENGYNNVTVIEAGLSDKQGEATFYIAKSSELNSLTDSDQSTSEIVVELNTLDAASETLNWSNIDFVKLDAEGEEINILAGGKQFFAENSPVVMYELMHLDTINVELIDAFEALGMASYVYNTSLGALLPYRKDASGDHFQLNLFAMRMETADKLSKRGLLLRQQETGHTIKLAQQPEQPSLPALKFNSDLNIEDKDYQSMLLHFALSHDVAQALGVRYAALMRAMKYVTAQTQTGKESRPERLLSYARVAQSAGQRLLAARILEFVIQRYAIDGQVFSVQEPFLVPEKTFDPFSHQDAKALLMGSALDAWVRLSSFSSYFADFGRHISTINFLEKMGMVRPDMIKRRKLMKEIIRLSQRTAVA